MLCFSSDWSTCQLSPNAVCGSGIKTRMLDCVRSDGKSVDIKFCQEVCLLLLFFGQPVFTFCLWHTRFFLNDLITLLFIIYYRALPVLLGLQHHEIFTTFPMLSLLSLLQAEHFYSFIMCLGSL